MDTALVSLHVGAHQNLTAFLDFLAPLWSDYFPLHHETGLGDLFYSTLHYSPLQTLKPRMSVLQDSILYSCGLERYWVMVPWRTALRMTEQTRGGSPGTWCLAGCQVEEGCARGWER